MNETTSIQNGIAIIGLAGHFPGANSPQELWANLKAGVESISQFSVDELEVENATRKAQDPSYVRSRSILPDVDQFDAEFFGIYPQEAKLMDPQHRVFLECCWEAFEDAGYDPKNCPGLVGVFAGCSQNSYFMTQVSKDQHFLREYAAAYQVGFYPTMLGAMPDTLATRVAYKFNLRGLSMTVQTACSTGLVAVSQACTNLLTFQCDLALAGAVSISFPQKRGYLYQEGGMVSPDGHCRSFDARAQGTVFGSGAGVVLLKRLEDAINDGDHIYAVIRGSAVNNDGSSKVGFTAPSVDGQAEVIALAQAEADVDPSTITYIEAHGTGTPLGDPIEVAALSKAFRARTDRKTFCALGTVKPNIGHLDVAAGMAGLIKTALALENKVLLPLLHFEQPNPKLELEGSPFYINTVCRPWEREAGVPRRAGVSAFGVGGTNVHAVLEEAPERNSEPSRRPAHLITLSARSPEALQINARRLSDYLEQHPDLNLADVCFTLQVGRHLFEYRLAVVAQSGEQAIADLRTALDVSQVRRGANQPEVCMMFPGQGSQYVNMGSGLYQTERIYQESFDECAELLLPLLGTDLRQIVFADDPLDSVVKQKLNQTRFAQPALFATEYALAKLWMSWGVHPARMIGHSVGEFVVAVLAGVLSLRDALTLIAKRSELMQSLPGGAMLSVRLSEAEAQAYLNDTVSLAAVNSPKLCVLAGPYDAIAAVESQLQAGKVAHRRLRTSHAFHSSMMDPIIVEFTNHVRQVSLHAPCIPYVSGVTGEWITADQATDIHYWARHFRETVRFSAGVERLRQSGCGILLEVGPGRTLETLVLQHKTLGDTGQITLSSIHESADTAHELSECNSILRSIGMLWKVGLELDWQSYQTDAKRLRVPLPTYPFERKRYWVETAEEERVSEVQEKKVTKIRTADEPKMVSSTVATATGGSARRQRFTASLIKLMQDLSGMEAVQINPSVSFLDLGFDSLFLTQLTQGIQSEFLTKITFRQLMTTYGSVERLAEYLLETAPSTVLADPLPEPPAIPHSLPERQNEILQPSVRLTATNDTGIPIGALERLLKEQLLAISELTARQLDLLRSTGVSSISQVPVLLATGTQVSDRTIVTEQSTKGTELAFQAFGPYKPIHSKPSTELNEKQRAYMARFIEGYLQRTAESKRLTQKYRRVLADPRVVSGFRAEWKEIVYPVTTVRSCGSRLWDVDGNEYIDILNGFGPIALGHMPDTIRDAVKQQLDEGVEIGPQTPLAGEVATLLCEMTGNERVTFCNTGSEAVMAALRLARTVTGRKKVVYFAGDYHGNFEEVLAKRIGKNGSLKSGPIAPGITPDAVANIIVLDYGIPESLDIIRQQGPELAAVILEPVQSRHPSLQPKEFLEQLRKSTEDSGTALIFDEVVTGFRVHPGGAQAWFGVRADLVTYGKVLGGGFPIGALAGKAAFMDALDGGMWQYGDDSRPETGVTFFAGTFVRHPLAMAAARAILLYLRDAGPSLQDNLSKKTAALVTNLNQVFKNYRIPSQIENFRSIFYFNLPAEWKFGNLFYYHLRAKGIHILEGFPCFLTTAHTESDLQRIVDAFDQSAREMAEAGLLPIMGGQDETRPAGKPVVSDQTLLEAPMTESQLEILLSAKVGCEASCSFNESFTLRLNGNLDKSAFQRAWKAVVERHDILRSTYDLESGLVRFEQHKEIELLAIDCTSESEPDTFLQSLVNEDACTPFDLERGPVVRACLLRMSDTDHVFFFSAHHIACDGWSINVIVEEMGILYAAFCRGKQATLPPPLSFGRYAEDLRRNAQSASQAIVRNYWAKQFEQLPPLLNLPLDHPRPLVKSFRGATIRAKIDVLKYQAIKKVGSAHGCTLFSTLLAGFQTLLCRLTGQDDIVVGIPAAGQALVGDQRLVGHSVNLLPLRAKFNENTTFENTLQHASEQLLDAYEHQTYTFGTLVRDLGVPRDPSRLPLVEVQFNLERFAPCCFEGLRVEMDSCGKKFVNFDLFLNVIEAEDGLTLDLDYNTTLFKETTVRSWLEHFEQLLLAATEEVEQPITNLNLLTQAQRQQLTVGWNDTEAPIPDPACVHSLIEQQAYTTPTSVAVSFGSETLTYAELNQRAEQLASFLVKRGVGPDRIVALVMDRSIEMLVGMLGVLKAGGTYLPLDPAYPRERLDFILGEADPAVILTTERLAIGLGVSRAHIVSMDLDWEFIRREPTNGRRVEISPKSLAYVIYTSGSTGKPKGVEISHQAVVNFLQSMRRVPGIKSQDRLLAVTTISFDIAALELLLPLIVGAEVVIASKQATTNGFDLVRLLEDRQITLMQATPGTWRLLIEAGWHPCPGFRVLCGGEAFPRDLADQLLALGCEVWNMYGPTETTIWSAVARVLPGSEPVRIGSPIDNTQFYVLNAQKQLQPLGVPGELYIAGEGVARGYHKGPELTAERFGPDPFRPQVNGRMYGTGDLVRRVPNGEIEFLGRLDQQVKIRGFRVELGEIETVLMKHPAVNEAVVLMQEVHAAQNLVAYFTSKPGATVSATEVRQLAARSLPAYMIPTFFQFLTEMPRTANNKVNRNGLPKVDQTARTSPRIFREPSNDQERVFVGICQEVLGLPKISLDDNLFELGADSIQIFRIAARARRANINISAQQVLEYRTVESILGAELAAVTPGTAPAMAQIKPVSRAARRIISNN